MNVKSQTHIQWLKHDFLGYLDRWEAEIQQTDATPGAKNQMCLSRETLEGLRITGVIPYMYMHYPHTRVLLSMYAYTCTYMQ